MEDFMTKNISKKEQIFKNEGSLKPVKMVLNEADAALGDPSRTAKDSSIPEDFLKALAGAGGAAAGGAASLTWLFFAGKIGFSAPGITSALAAAGALVGGGMVAGVGVLAAPVAILAVTGYGTVSKLQAQKLAQEKERLYQLALQKHDAIIRELNEKHNNSEERAEYLNSLNILLREAIKNLKADIGKGE